MIQFDLSKMKPILPFMKIPHVNVTMLRVLVSISETESFSRTAGRLGLTQSAVSHALRGFEATVGARLMLRGRKGVALTAAGEKALAAARQALAAIAEIGRLAEAPVEGRVRLALINSASVRIAPRVLVAAGARYPRLAIDILLGTDREVVEWLERGAADLGISFERSAKGRADILLHDEFYAVAAPGRRPSAAAIALRDLDRTPFIMSAGGCAPMLAGLFEAAGIRPDIRLSAHDMGALLALVGAGHGVSIAPGLSFPRDWERLVERHPLQPRLIRPLWLLDAGRAHDDPCVAVLREMIMDAAIDPALGKA